MIFDGLHSLMRGDRKQGGARVRARIAIMSFCLPSPAGGRWFCPRCHAKKVAQFGELLLENILYPLLHRQYVFSVRIIPCKFFLYNRKLLSKLSKAAEDSLQLFLRTALGQKDGIFAAVLTIQIFAAIQHTAGDYARWHPHIHSIVADRLFRRTGVFHVMP